MIRSKGVAGYSLSGFETMQFRIHEIRRVTASTEE
jgi:hypothetical protein